MDSKQAQAMVDLFIAMLIEISAIPTHDSKSSSGERREDTTKRLDEESSNHVTKIAESVFALLDAVIGASEATRQWFFGHRDFGRLLEAACLRACNPKIRAFSSRCLMQLFTRINAPPANSSNNSLESPREMQVEGEPAATSAEQNGREGMRTEVKQFLASSVALLEVLQHDYEALNERCTEYFALLLHIVPQLNGLYAEVYALRDHLMQKVLELIRSNTTVIESEEQVGLFFVFPLFSLFFFVNR
jgi:hypothetical protein